MHELAIADSIVSAVLQEIERQNLPRVEKIVVRVGVLSDVVPEALQFNFEVITRDTPLAESELVIEHVPLAGACKTCGDEFSVQNYIFACPACGSGQIQVTRGQELDIAYLEVEDRRNEDPGQQLTEN